MGPHPFTLLLSLALVGCVAKGRHELVEVQLDATRAALNTSQAACRTDASEALEAYEKLEQEIADAQNQLGAAREAVRESDAEIDKLAQREADHVIHDLTTCPEPELDPETGELPKEAPALVEKRKELEASVEQITAALAAAARRDLATTTLTNHHSKIERVFEPLISDKLAVVTREDDVSVVSILTAKLFNENRTTLSPLGVSIVERVAASLRELPGDRLVLVGHTDDRPVHTATHASNWELGFGYAMGVLRELEYLGIPMAAKASSAAGTEPAQSNADPAGRRLNRRVELRISADPAVLERALAVPDLGVFGKIDTVRLRRIQTAGLMEVPLDEAKLEELSVCLSSTVAIDKSEVIPEQLQVHYLLDLTDDQGETSSFELFTAENLKGKYGKAFKNTCVHGLIETL